MFVPFLSHPDVSAQQLLTFVAVRAWIDSIHSHSHDHTADCHYTHDYVRDESVLYRASRRRFVSCANGAASSDADDAEETQTTAYDALSHCTGSQSWSSSPRGF